MAGRALRAASAIAQRHAFPTARRRRIFLILLGAPALIYVLAVAIWPLAQGVSYSFYDYSLLRPSKTAFVGLDNYRALWSQRGRAQFDRRQPPPSRSPQ